MKRSDYISSVSSIFDNPLKFTKGSSDPTSTRLHSLQTYLSTHFKQGEITEYKFLRPKAAAFGRAHRLPKTHKPFVSVPKFRLIINTTNTPHYNVGKFLSNLLNPLTLNDYTLRDSFEAVDAIKAIPEHLFSKGYR